MNTGASGFRSIGVNKATVNEKTQTISKMTLNKSGVTAIKNLNPYEMQEMETMATCGGVSYEDFSNISTNTSINTLGNDASRNLQVRMKAGSWTQLRKVDFGTEGAVGFMLRARGTGTLEIRLNNRAASPAATVEFSSTGYSNHSIELDAETFRNVKTVYLVVTEATDAYLDAWQFTEMQTDAVAAPVGARTRASDGKYRLDGTIVNGKSSRKGIIVERVNGQGRKRVAK